MYSADRQRRRRESCRGSERRRRDLAEGGNSPDKTLSHGYTSRHSVRVYRRGIAPIDGRKTMSARFEGFRWHTGTSTSGTGLFY